MTILGNRNKIRFDLIWYSCLQILEYWMPTYLCLHAILIVGCKFHCQIQCCKVLTYPVLVDSCSAGLYMVFTWNSLWARHSLTLHTWMGSILAVLVLLPALCLQYHLHQYHLLSSMLTDVRGSRCILVVKTPPELLGLKKNIMINNYWFHTYITHRRMIEKEYFLCQVSCFLTVKMTKTIFNWF